MHQNIKNTKILHIPKIQAYKYILGKVITNFKTNWLKSNESKKNI